MSLRSMKFIPGFPEGAVFYVLWFFGGLLLYAELCFFGFSCFLSLFRELAFMM